MPPGPITNAAPTVSLMPEGDGAGGPHRRVRDKQERGQAEKQVEQGRRQEHVGVRLLPDLHPAAEGPEAEAYRLRLGDKERQHHEGQDGADVADGRAVPADLASAAPHRDRRQEGVVEHERRLVREVRRHEQRHPYNQPARDLQPRRQEDRDQGEHDQRSCKPDFPVDRSCGAAFL